MSFSLSVSKFSFGKVISPGGAPARAYVTSYAKWESSSLFTATSPAYAFDYRANWCSRDTAYVAPRRATVRGISFICLGSLRSDYDFYL